MTIQEFISYDEFKEVLAINGKFVLRPSAIQQFINCPAQWFRTQLLKDPRKPAAAAEAGTSLHKGAEVGYTEKIKTGELPPLSVLTDVVAETWRVVNQENEIEFKSGETYETYEKDLILGISEYHKQVMPEINPVSVETRYSIPLESDVFAEVGGTIDINLVNGIADLKMTNKKPVLAKYLLQQSTYALLKSHNGEDCEYAEIHSVQRGKSSERLGLNIKKDYARTWINTILDTVESFDKTKDTSLFRGSNPSSNFLCSESWCGYWDKCPFVKGLR